MAVSISNLSVNNNAPAGTTVGALTVKDASGHIVNCNFSVTKNSAGYFTISSSNLVTAWSGLTVPGYYSVRVNAVGTNTRFSGQANLMIKVLPTIAPPPPPPSIPTLTFSSDGLTVSYSGPSGTDLPGIRDNVPLFRKSLLQGQHQGDGPPKQCLCWLCHGRHER